LKIKNELNDFMTLSRRFHMVSQASTGKYFIARSPVKKPEISELDIRDVLGVTGIF
jgi:ABC-type molybdenum transport system ATPase subunit/photorepair protein PhrA